MHATDLTEYSEAMYEHITGDFHIRIHPNPVLSEVCEPIAEEEFGPDLHTFGVQMIDRMVASKGVGLAASQVGLLKRMFVMEYPTNPVIVCNPVLELGDETFYAEEGCLSMPGVQGQVIRSRKVLMHFRTPMGAAASITLLDVLARVVQHETDHLDGVMFVDRMPRNLRKQVQRSWEAKQRKIA